MVEHMPADGGADIEGEGIVLDDEDPREPDIVINNQPEEEAPRPSRLQLPPDVEWKLMDSERLAWPEIESLTVDGFREEIGKLSFTDTADVAEIAGRKDALMDEIRTRVMLHNLRSNLVQAKAAENSGDGETRLKKLRSYQFGEKDFRPGAKSYEKIRVIPLVDQAMSEMKRRGDFFKKGNKNKDALITEITNSLGGGVAVGRDREIAKAMVLAEELMIVSGQAQKINKVPTPDQQRWINAGSSAGAVIRDFLLNLFSGAAK